MNESAKPQILEFGLKVEIFNNISDEHWHEPKMSNINTFP